MKTVSLSAFLCAAALSLSINSAQAQSAGPQTGNNPPPTAATPDPVRLPGDRGPMAPRTAQSGSAPSARPPMEQGTDAAGPSLAVAIEAAQAAVAACAADGFKIGVAVIDSTGEPRAALSADHANGGHIYTAVRKSLAALAFGMPTSAVTAEQRASAVARPNMTIMAGAIPLMVGDKVIGAIGASGASSQQDEKCALAGATKVKDQLR